MAIQSIGDQARAFVLQSQTARLRSTLDVLTSELSSGQVADRAARLSGNTAQLHHFESQIAILNEYKASGQEVAGFAQATQDVLSALHADVADYSANTLSTGSATSANTVPLRASEARSIFLSAISKLNTKVAGLHLFAGEAVDMPPLAAAEAILGELEALTAGLSTTADIETAISGWFDAPPGGGGYLDFAYSGTIGTPRVVKISEERVISFTTSAATPTIRDMLKGLAIGAIAGSDLIAADGAERLRMINRAGQALRSNETAMLDEIGRVGLLQALADRFSTEHSNALAVAEMGRAQLITADPFQTATALQQVQTQMETLYQLTARLSGLKLVEYLR